MSRSIVALVVLLIASGSPVFAQQGTADLRGRVVDQQGAVLPGVTVVVRHQESGLFRETVSGADGTFLMSAMTPGCMKSRRSCRASRSIAARRASRGRPHRAGRAEARSRRPDRVGDRDRGSAARRYDDAGDRRPHQRAGVRRHAVVQPQLRRLSRHAAGRGGDDFGDDVRRRLDQRRRPERAQRQLHDGRVEQQRHVQRRQRRRAGARAGRSGAGVPAADAASSTPSTASRPAASSTRCRSRAPTSITAPRSCSSRTRSCRRSSTSRSRKGCEEAPIQAAAVRRRARRPDHPRQGALLRQRRAHPARFVGDDQHPDAARSEPHRLRDHARVEHLPPRRSSDQRQTTPGASAGCARLRRSRCRFRTPTTRRRGTRRRPTSTGRSSATSAR